MHRKRFTYVFDEHDQSIRYYPEKYGIDRNAPRLSYAAPNDVPVSLRHTIKRAHESGLTAENLALIYELPRTLVERLCKARSAGIGSEGPVLFGISSNLASNIFIIVHVNGR